MLNVMPDRQTDKQRLQLYISRYLYIPSQALHQIFFVSSPAMNSYWSALLVTTSGHSSHPTQDGILLSLKVNIRQIYLLIKEYVVITQPLPYIFNPLGSYQTCETQHYQHLSLAQISSQRAVYSVQCTVYNDNNAVP